MIKLIDVIFVFISLVSLVITLMLYRGKNDRQEKVNCEKMLMAVFEMQINMPELSLVYDSIKIQASVDMLDKYELRKEPFIIYILSVFDLVIDYYSCRYLFSSKDTIMKTAWINTIKNFFKDSSDGRNVYQTHHDEFNKRFQEFSDEVLKSI